MMKIGVFLMFIGLGVSNIFAQCPQIANVEVISNDVSCFGLNDGSIRVSIKDSNSLSANKFYFVLYAWSGSGLTKKATIGTTSPKYSTTFTGISTGSYDVLIVRTANTNPCTTFPFFTGNVAIASIPNTNTTYKTGFVKQQDQFASVQINQPVAISAGTYAPILDSTHIDLNADDPAPVGFPASVGTWSVASGSNIPHFSDVHDPNAKVSDLLPGQYLFKWTMSKPGCPDRTDTTLLSVEVSKPIENDFSFKKKLTKIVGKVFYDYNKNSIRDENEGFVAYQSILTNLEGFGAFTDNEGKFELLLTDAGSYEIGLKPRLNFELSPTVLKSYDLGSYDSLVFFVTPLDVLKPDLKVDITPVYPFAQPNLPYILQAEISNLGEQASGGKITIDLPKEFILDSVPRVMLQNNVYVIDSLFPSRILRFLLYGHISNNATIGAKITFSASVNSNVRDADESNNQSTTVREIVDVPVNKRTEASTSNLSNNVVLVQIDTLLTPQIQNDQDITYTIYFQNEGSKKATTVVIYDSLSPLLNTSTIGNLIASRLCVPTLCGGVYSAKFPNINMPTSTVDLAKSIAFFKFNIKAKKNPLPAKGVVIVNKASIYFDSVTFKNTSKAATLVWNDVITSLEETRRTTSFSAYPNPNTGDLLHLNLPQGCTYKFSTLQGEVVMNGIVQEEAINISALPQGVYLLEAWHLGEHRKEKVVRQ